MIVSVESAFSHRPEAFRNAASEPVLGVSDLKRSLLQQLLHDLLAQPKCFKSSTVFRTTQIYGVRNVLCNQGKHKPSKRSLAGHPT